jgi:hypothetical protein
VVWHGDALDVPRHALLAGIQAHLALTVAFALVCDAFAGPPAIVDATGVREDSRLPGRT